MGELAAEVPVTGDFLSLDSRADCFFGTAPERGPDFSLELARVLLPESFTIVLTGGGTELPLLLVDAAPGKKNKHVRKECIRTLHTLEV